MKITNNALLYPFETITTPLLLIEFLTATKISVFSTHIPKVTFSTKKCEK